MRRDTRTRIVDWLRRERDQHISGGLYHTTQLVFAWNSSHMEGSTLTPDQTAQLYDTGALLATGPDDQIKADDVIETTNHFRAFNWMLDHVDDPVDKTLLCHMHAILKHGTSQEADPDRNVGGWKTLPNVIDPIEENHTVLPWDVPAAMNDVATEFHDLTDDPYRIAHAHWMFETTHPFSDGNGRVGRLILFKELLRLDAMPPLFRDQNHNYYIRGLKTFGTEPGYLVDTILTERDYYRKLADTLAPDRVRYTYNDDWSAQRQHIETDMETHPATNPWILTDWTDIDMTRHTPSERYIPGIGFITPDNNTTTETPRID